MPKNPLHTALCDLLDVKYPIMSFNHCPHVAVAVAIHGASQHMAGCAGAKNIVAINWAPDAPIFKYARFGIVGDCNEIMPALIERCREVVGAKD